MQGLGPVRGAQPQFGANPFKNLGQKLETWDLKAQTYIDEVLFKENKAEREAEMAELRADPYVQTPIGKNEWPAVIERLKQAQQTESIDFMQMISEGLSKLFK